MRKETIIKYEKEFLAWCKGESVLLGAPISIHDRTLIWREVRDFKDWKHLDTVYVLNDSYSIYRKALAEGKIIQLDEAAKFSDPNRGWVDLSCKSFGGSTHLFPVNYYRIKPEEPKFKVGDWVRVKTNTFEYDGTARISKGVKRLSKSDMWLFNENHYKCSPDNYIEHWQPKPDEWCWFWNFTDMPILAKLISIEYFLLISLQDSLTTARSNIHRQSIHR